MRYAIRLAVLFCCAFAGLQVVPANAEKRVALVIGNGSYTHIAHLPNVANDAAAMAALFKAAKFDAVDVRHNLSVAELRRALREFAGQAADADVAVLFYAGHGIEVGQVNYLIPVDARLVTDFDVEDETVPLDRVLQAMEPAKRLRLVILDACRENPFVGSMKRTVGTRSIGRGLGRVEPSISNTLIAFATRPSAIAEDGKGPNSPFTAALVKHLMTPGLDLRIALGHVRDEVMASTASKQEPYVTGSLGGGILSIADAPRSGAHPQSSEAERAWALVKGTTSIHALEAFIRGFGDTYYGDLGKVRLAELRQVEVAKREADAAAEATKNKADEEARAKRLAKLQQEQRQKGVSEANKSASVEKGKAESDPAKLAALSKVEKPGHVRRFDGAWTITTFCNGSPRSSSIRIEAGAISGQSGVSGSVSPSGVARWTTGYSDFSGVFRDRSGAGRYTPSQMLPGNVGGGCRGTFQARLN